MHLIRLLGCLLSRHDPAIPVTWPNGQRMGICARCGHQCRADR